MRTLPYRITSSRSSERIVPLRAIRLAAGIDEPQLRRLYGGLRPACHLERPKDRRDVRFHRAFGKTQLPTVTPCSSFRRN